ncbi:MAG: hypothetical protein R3A51_03825 [Nannocystaceae bacterium]
MSTPKPRRNAPWRLAAGALAFLTALTVGACEKKDSQSPEGGVQCGEHDVCSHPFVCCNPSCGICVEPGGMCTQQVCE